MRGCRYNLDANDMHPGGIMKPAINSQPAKCPFNLLLIDNTLKQARSFAIDSFRATRAETKVAGRSM
jgi:hypothetical protein